MEILHNSQHHLLSSFARLGLDAYGSHVHTYLCWSTQPAIAFASYVAASFVSNFVMELKKQPISRDSATEDDKQGESQAGLPLVLAMEPPRSNGSKEQVDPSRG